MPKLLATVVFFLVILVDVMHIHGQEQSLTIVQANEQVELAIDLSRDGRYDEALRVWRAILAKSNEPGMEYIHYDALAGIAHEHKNLLNLDSALQYALEAFAFRDDHKLIVDRPIEARIGEIYLELGNHPQAEEFFRRSLAWSGTGPSSFSVIALYYMARIFIETEQVDSFLKYQTALTTATSESESQPSFNIYHLEYLFRDASGGFDEQKLHSMMASAGDSMSKFIPLAYGLLARHALDKGDAATALGYADQAIEKEYVPRDLLGHAEIKAQALAALGRYEEAYRAMGEVQSLTYRMFEDDARSRIDKLRVQFETERKEKEILSQQAEIRGARNQRSQLILALACVLVVAGMVILFLRQRMARKELISRQEKMLHDQRVVELEREKRLLAMTGMIEGQEAERSRVAQDLHDGLGALLASVKAHFDLIQSKVQSNGHSEVFRKTTALVDHACEEVSRISRNMMPKALAENGLVPALQDLGLLAGEGYGLRVDIETRGMEERLDETTEVMIFRIFQELVSNVGKHAKANTMLLQCVRSEDELFLLVEDDGIGFEYITAIENGGLGLGSVQSRVGFLNGEVEFDARQNKGTSVSINIPLHV